MDNEIIMRYIDEEIKNDYEEKRQLARDRAQCKLLEGLYLKKYNLQLQNGTCFKAAQELHDEILQLSKEGRSKKRIGPMHYFITVNPPNDVDLDLFRKRVNKLINRKFVSFASYAFEQRGETIEDVHGWHCHIVLTHNGLTDSDLRRYVKSTMKDVVPDVDNKRHLNVLPITPGTEYRSLRYITGGKKSEKQAKVICDVQARLDYGFEPPYIAPQHLPLVKDAGDDDPKISDDESSDE